MAKPWLIRYFQCFYTGNTCRPWSHAITILRRKFWFFLMKFLNDLLLFSWSSFVMRIIYPYSMYSLNGLISFINTSAVCSENFEKIECSQNQKYNLNWMYKFFTTFKTEKNDFFQISEFLYFADTCTLYMLSIWFTGSLMYPPHVYVYTHLFFMIN